MTNFLLFQNLPDLGISATTLTIIIVAAIVLILLVTIVPTLLMTRKIFGGIAGNLQQTQTLLATGEAAQAKILRMWDTGTTLNGNPQIGLLLEIHALNRTPYQVETTCFVSRLRIPQVQPGATVNVKIDPQNPANVALQLA
jgi:hypothetical protein